MTSAEGDGDGAGSENDGTEPADSQGGGTLTSESEEQVDEPADPFPPSGACSQGRVRWDAGLRRLEKDNLYWVLDEAGRPVEHGQIDDSGWWHRMQYDAHGTLVRFEQYLSTGLSWPASWDATNSYDEQGRLTQSSLTYRVGPPYTILYRYRDGEPGPYEIETIKNESTVSLSRIVYENGRVSERTVQENSGSALYHRELPTYDAAGHLTRLEHDELPTVPEPDGVADIVQSWSYDAAGRCSGFTQDGSLVTPVTPPDGVADEQQAFEPECALIAVLPNEVYGFPEWFRR